MNGNLPAIFKGYTDIVNAVDFSPGGDRVFPADRVNTARMWSRDGNLLQVFRGHSSTLLDVDCSPDGSAIVTASNDCTAVSGR